MRRKEFSNVAAVACCVYGIAAFRAREKLRLGEVGQPCQ